MDTFKEELKKQIIDQLNLEDVQVSDIGDDTPLFGEGGIGLDSIDALELIVLLEKYYGIQVVSPEEGKQAFTSVNSMTDYINKRKA